MLVPTRERSANFRRFVESVISTASHPDRIEVHCYIDQDDAELDAYMAIIEDLEKSDGVTFGGGVGNPVGVPGAMNQLGIACKTDLLMISNDDQVFITKEWDIRLDEEAEVSRWHFCFLVQRQFRKRTDLLFSYSQPEMGGALVVLLTDDDGAFLLRHVVDGCRSPNRPCRLHTRHFRQTYSSMGWPCAARRDGGTNKGPLYEGRINRDELTYRRLARYRDVDADILRKALEPSTYEIATGRIAGSPFRAAQRSTQNQAPSISISNRITPTARTFELLSHRRIHYA